MGGGGVPRWLIGVMINILGSVSINFGTNLMKLAHNDKERAARAEDARLEKERREFEALPEEQGGSGSVDEPDMMIRKGGLLQSLFNRFRRRVVPSGMSRESLQQRWRTRKPLGVWCRSMFIPDKPLKIWLREKVWGVGVVIFVTGSILVFLSFAYAPQSMLAALGSSQFVSNVVFARFVLGERITLRVIGATSIIVGGQVLIVMFAAHVSQNYTAVELMALYNRTYLTYLGSIFIVCCILQLTYQQYRYYEAQEKPLPLASTVLPVSYAMLSALVGTYSVLQAKCLSALLTATLKGNNQFGYFFTWLCLVMWITLTIFWLHRMNTALLLFDGLFIIPVLQVFWTFFAIVGGGVYFQEFQAYSVGDLIGFCCGVVTIFIGVILLSPRRAVAPEEFQALGDGEGEEGGVCPAVESPGVLALTTPVEGGAAAAEAAEEGRKHHKLASDGTGMGGSGKQLVRRGSLEVLERRTSRLISLNTMPFITNDEGFAHIVDKIVTPDTEHSDEHGAHLRQGSGRDLLGGSLRHTGTARSLNISGSDQSRSSHDPARGSRDRRPGSGDHAHPPHQGRNEPFTPSSTSGSGGAGSRRPSLDEILEARRTGRTSADGHAARAPHPLSPNPVSEEHAAAATTGGAAQRQPPPPPPGQQQQQEAKQGEAGSKA